MSVAITFDDVSVTDKRKIIVDADIITSSAADAEAARQAAEEAEASATSASGYAESASASAEAAGASAESAAASAEEAEEIVSGLTEEMEELQEQMQTKAPAIYATASGSIATFSDGADDMPCKSVVCQIDAVQDLHGQDAPYPAGGGKNLLKLNDGTYTPVAGSYVVISDGKMTITGSVTGSGGRTRKLSDVFLLKAGTYILSPEITNPYVRGYLNKASDDSAVGNYSGTAFTTTEDIEVYYGINLEGGKTYNVTLYPQLELGSSATSFAPYSNICPITGWDGVTVKRTGKNLINGFISKSQTTAGITWTDNGDGTITAQGTATANTSFTLLNASNMSEYPMINGAEVSLTGCPSGGSTATYYINAYRCKTNGTTTASDVGDGVTFVWSTGEESFNVSIVIKSGTTLPASGLVFKPQLEIGGITEFKPYQGIAHSISFPSTVYGGWVDVVKGELHVDRACVTLTDFTNWNYQTGSNYVALLMRFDYMGIPLPNLDSNKRLMTVSSAFKYTVNTNGAPFGAMTILNYNNGTLYFWNNDAKYADANEIKQALTEIAPQICYYLAEPIVYQLDPVTIKTLLGNNNIYADTGDTTAQYPADTKLYIDGKFVQLQALILES